MTWPYLLSKTKEIRIVEVKKIETDAAANQPAARDLFWKLELRDRYSLPTMREREKSAIFSYLNRFTAWKKNFINFWRRNRNKKLSLLLRPSVHVCWLDILMFIYLVLFLFFCFSYYIYICVDQVMMMMMTRWDVWIYTISLSFSHSSHRLTINLSHQARLLWVY